MTIFTGGTTFRSGFTVEQLPTSTGEYLKATASEAWARSPFSSLAWMYDARIADLDSEHLSYEDAKNLLADSPVGDAIDVPPEGISWGRLEMIEQAKYQELVRQNIMGRANQGALGTVAGFGVGMMTAMVDPFNLAISLIPFAGAGYRAAMAGATGGLGRFAVRARYGALGGITGAAVTEPAVYLSAQQQQAEYGYMDSLLAIGLGGIAGGVFYGVGGMIGDALSRMPEPPKHLGDAVASINAASMAPDEIAPRSVREAVSRTLGVRVPEPMASPFITRLSRLSRAEKVEVFQSAFYQVLEDKPVRVDAIINELETLRARKNRMQGRPVADEQDLYNQVVEDIIQQEWEAKAAVRVGKKEKQAFGKQANKLRAEAEALQSQVDELAGRPMPRRKRELVRELEAKRAELEDLRARQKRRIREYKAIGKRINEAKKGNISPVLKGRINTEFERRMRAVQDMEQGFRTGAREQFDDLIAELKELQQQTSVLHRPGVVEENAAKIAEGRDDFLDEFNARFGSEDDVAATRQYLKERYNMDVEDDINAVREAMDKVDQYNEKFQRLARCLGDG